MGAIEIVLLVAGAAVAVLSFVLPASQETVSPETRELAQEEIHALVDKEMDGIRSHVDDVVDEAIEYAMEKTERSLERLTNEKIMAVNEYSDTVLREIRKNHEETVFLYDMLNDKHTNLKNTVSEVNKTVQEVAETKKEAEAMVSSFQQLIPERVMAEDKVLRLPEERTAGAPAEKIVRMPEQTTERPTIAAAKDTGHAVAKKADKPAKKTALQAQSCNPAVVDLDLAVGDNGNIGAVNNNERILELHRQGKSTVAIAKELGLGVGEVKLVIDLYKNL